MTDYAIGDIQGCFDALQCLLKKINFKPKKDTLWLAGDLVNRGTQSLETLRFVIKNQESIRCVLGNHDLHLIAVARGHRQIKRNDSLEEVISAPDCAQIIDWLRRQPLLISDDSLDYVMTHAGIPPQWSLEQTKRYAREVENTLKSEKIDAFLSEMYGNEPAIWDEKLSGTARLRCIVNYLTRMRICTADGQLDFQFSDSPENQLPKDFSPWFAHQHRKTRKHKLIFGHWAALQGQCSETNVFALDTGCVWGGQLTAMRLDNKKRISCAC